MSTPTEYRGCQIEVDSYKHTWGTYIGRWSGNVHIWYEGEQKPFSATVDKDCETSGEAEANALRVAKGWIDQRAADAEE